LKDGLKVSSGVIAKWSLNRISTMVVVSRVGQNTICRPSFGISTGRLLHIHFQVSCSPLSRGSLLQRNLPEEFSEGSPREKRSGAGGKTAWCCLSTANHGVESKQSPNLGQAISNSSILQWNRKIVPLVTEDLQSFASLASRS
jgi:hypothetical protein